MIVINGRYLSQRMTGIQRFAYEITNALVQMAEEPIVVLAPQDIREEYNIQKWDVCKIGGNGSHFWEQVTLLRYMKRHLNGELLLSLSGLCPIGYKNNILTIHDVAYLIKPRSFSRIYCLYYHLMTPIAARKARHIVTVSEFSKREIMRYLHLAESNLSVVYNAVHPCNLALKKNLPRYILSVCSLAPRKNLKRLIEAFLQIPNKDFELYLIGGTNNIFSDSKLHPYQNTPNIHFLGYVDETTMQMYYRNAIAYVNASLYEGFGIPNLEAMQQHCAIAVSDIPAYREVCGNAAIYFNPLNTKDIQSKIEEIVDNEKLRQDIIKQGSEQLSKFNWNQSAQILMNKISIYEKSKDSVCR